MTKPIILRTDAELAIIEQYMDEIARVADVVTAQGEDAETLAALAADADIILTCYTPIPAAVIEGASKLKAIIKYGVGTDNIDIVAATANNVMVANCPDYGSDTVADHAFALLISLARKITVIDRTMRAEAWTWPRPEIMGLDLSQKTMGLIGFGRIGRAMARRCAGFSMDLLVHDPYVDEAVITNGLAVPAGLDELLGKSDFVSIHCVLTGQTRGLIGEGELKKMKDTALLIDVSRGAIVDEAALIKALDNGWIGGAGFDVYPQEPLTENNPLLGRDNVIATPHLAWYTAEAFERVEKDTFTQVMQVLDGKKPKHLKNTEVSTSVE